MPVKIDDDITYDLGLLVADNRGMKVVPFKIKLDRSVWTLAGRSTMRMSRSARSG